MAFDCNAPLFVVRNLMLVFNTDPQGKPDCAEQHGAQELDELCKDEQARRRLSDRQIDWLDTVLDGLFEGAHLSDQEPVGAANVIGEAWLRMFVAALPTDTLPAIFGCHVDDSFMNNTDLVTDFFPQRMGHIHEYGVVYLIVRETHATHVVVDAVMPNWDIPQPAGAYYDQTHADETIHTLLHTIL